MTGMWQNDTLLGWNGVDILRGLDGDDVLQGGGSGDTLDGGNGIDLLDYTGSSAAVTVNFNAGTASGGDATGDTFTNIEGVKGSSYDDIFNDATSRDIEHVYDGAGGSNDTLSYEYSTASMIIDLSAGSAYAVTLQDNKSVMTTELIDAAGTNNNTTLTNQLI
jgi:hypothetical protein